MLKYNTRAKLGFVFILIWVAALSSCKSYKDIAYFDDLPDSLQVVNIKTAEYSQPVIQSDDILSISIQTIDPQLAAPVNQSVTMPAIGSSSSSSIGSQQITGFLVDQNGEVELSMIGKVKLAGQTTHQARDLIKQKASLYYKQPSVQVRFANFKVTVIGEVAKPAAYTLPNENVSILDALGLAGDLTIFGKRENVLLVRDNNGEKQFVRFNLNKSEIFRSPYFYLKQNDVIYVEPNEGKAASTDAARNRTFTIAASLLSVILVVASRIL